MRDTYLRDHAAHNREKKISWEENQRMGGASQARVPQRTPGWVLWTVEEILSNAGEPEPTTTFWMYTSIWIRISTCDRSNSMVMRCNDRCSQPIDKLIAEKILRYDRTILELSFLSTHTSVWNVFYPVASHAYYVTFYFRFTFFYLITRGCSGKGDGLLDPNFLSDTQTFMRVRPNVR